MHQLKRAQRHLEFLEIQESYIKDEMKNLKREMIRAKEEVRQIQSVPLVIGQFIEMVNLHYGIVTPTRCRVLARVCVCVCMSVSCVTNTTKRTSMWWFLFAVVEATNMCAC